MIREVDINEISDGRKYGSNDMVKTDCQGCSDCHKCCSGMGKSVVLSPLDCYQISTCLQIPVTEMLDKHIELNVVDGIILPNLIMNGENEECTFLDNEGRCSIHIARPDICRMFPLGRIYENHTFQYFLQKYECPKEDKTKVKVSRWLGVDNIAKYEKYINEWHEFLLDIQNILKNEESELCKQVDLYILKKFYLTPYDYNMDFYVEFSERLADSIKMLLPI